MANELEKYADDVERLVRAIARVRFEGIPSGIEQGPELHIDQRVLGQHFLGILFPEYWSQGEDIALGKGPWPWDHQALRVWFVREATERGVPKSKALFQMTKGSRQGFWGFKPAKYARVGHAWELPDAYFYPGRYEKSDSTGPIYVLGDGRFVRASSTSECSGLVMWNRYGTHEVEQIEILDFRMVESMASVLGYTRGLEHKNG